MLDVPDGSLVPTLLSTATAIQHMGKSYKADPGIEPIGILVGGGHEQMHPWCPLLLGHLTELINQVSSIALSLVACQKINVQMCRVAE